MSQQINRTSPKSTHRHTAGVRMENSPWLFLESIKTACDAFFMSRGLPSNDAFNERFTKKAK